MFDTYSQISIFVLGLLATFLLTIKSRWGSVIGLLSQPAWLYTAWHANQWGIFALSICYCLTYLMGFVRGFIFTAKPLNKPVVQAGDIVRFTHYPCTYAGKLTIERRNIALPEFIDLDVPIIHLRQATEVTEVLAKACGLNITKVFSDSTSTVFELVH